MRGVRYEETDIAKITSEGRGGIGLAPNTTAENNPKHGIFEV
jgi:hypothetical protein